MQILRFIYSSFSQIFLSNGALYAKETNRFLTYPLKQDVPHSSDLVLLLKGAALFILQWQSLVGCPIHSKRRRIKYIRLLAQSALL